MKQLIKGLHKFRDEVFAEKKPLFERLSRGQSPEVAFLTCSDSRINPALITQTEPGDLFILRNAGNFIPPHGSGVNGEAATLQYAIEVLKVKDLIVCGHSHCGAVKHLIELNEPSPLKFVDQWVKNGERTRQIINLDYPALSAESRLNVAIQENVLVQIEQARSYPFIESALRDGVLNIHGWVYKFETGEVFSYDFVEQQFLLID